MQENVIKVTALTLRPSHPPGDIFVSVRWIFKTRQVMHVFYFMQVTPYKPRENTEAFYWRTPVLPNKAFCPKLMAWPQNPTQIHSNSIQIENIDITAEKVLFQVYWDPPTYLNGGLDHYELCISEDVPGDRDECAGRLQNKETGDLVSFQLMPSITELAVQVGYYHCVD